ncbi:uncharacterized protein [Amphiura filiformis]|uniref:uncharacterized protein isoform X1 n=1 Tax=Amphiura filiformis TaxID=82378 RepID=UPI003B21A32D
MEPLRKEQATECSQHGRSGEGKPGNFERHMNTHDVQESFQCTTCGKAFSGADILEEHKKACNPVSSEGYVDVTNMIDTSAEGRSDEGTSDEDTNSTEGAFEVMNGNSNEPGNIMKCLKCGGLFSGTEALVKHVMLVHRRKRTEGHRGPIEREEPANAGIRATESHIQAMELLRQDQRTESNLSEEGRYTCGVCGKQFIRQGNLDRHVTTHRRQKSFSCPTCRKSFPRVDVLRIHKTVCQLAAKKKLLSQSNGVGASHKIISEGGKHNHKQVKKLKCPKCSELFSGKEVLSKHIIKAHCKKKKNLPQKVAKLKCSKCNKLFSGKDALAKHVMKVHRKKNLTQLARPLSRNNTLHKHALKILAKSTPKITEEKNACGTCGKLFHFRSHLRRHENLHVAERTNDQACPLCGKIFSRADSVTKHQQTCQIGKRSVKFV